MRRILTMVAALAAMTASAQFGAPRVNPTVPSVTAEVEDFKPATTNQEGKQYPMVNSERMVRAQISAPKASFVGLDIDGKIYFSSERDLEPGEFVNVRITGTMDGELTGEAAEEE